ncbi:MAG: bifunctional methylenetetrahydrofolate dehydrogenase/methenyltetrahydrofolate cyclohydrolase FolD [Akkermansiaceae bacterium]|nr:bifunctional methylenetetrahydrofolate dehydrogenase/methenyltetrahydrofolate cyclohydrolase FolD [Akkermansiaceae bacterium]MCP5551152.1 bifunctional methylenetetrahydrofolate dehydrogenase/methenyltetrahydrofolate cyclohydrolase FolD [Akkermansiaceae bacterium]
MKRIEGKPIAESVYAECLAEFERLRTEGHLPGLAVVLVGEDPASQAYVASKERKCRELGFHSVKIEMSAFVSQAELLQTIAELNADPAIHGILVQMPLPSHLDTDAAIRAIDPCKDVDGLHPENLGKLAMEDATGFAPCTPLGCQRMLIESGIETSGRNVVIVGRSLLVGKSLALLLMAKGPGGDATVTVAHSRTKNLAEVTRRADIVVAAIGRPHFIGPDHVKEGAVVIDVGINRVDDTTAKRGYRLVGDVDYDAVAPRCEAITPVPGGVGVMTIAMLMRNTIQACKLAVEREL